MFFYIKIWMKLHVWLNLINYLFSISLTLFSSYWSNGFRGPYVDCAPNTPVDRENMGGELKFAPQSQELPFIYFPYLNQDNYMTPFIAIKFNKPNRNVYIGITCRLWSANLTDSNIGTPEEPSAVLPLHLYIE